MDSYRRLAMLRLVFWLAATAALVFALLPHPVELPGNPNDKLQHIAAFLTLGALGSFAYPRTNPIYLGAGLSLFGALIEFLQMIPALHRDSDAMDWMADTAAAALIIIVLRWLTGWRSEAASEKG
jgi:VanZ family protein